MRAKKTSDEKVKSRGLFDHINHIREVKNKNYYVSLSEEEKKSFGFAYLGIIYYQLGDREKAAYYYHKIIANSKDYNIPELYYSGTNTPNDNTPLG